MRENPSRRLYMDNAATSFPKPKAVLEAMSRYTLELGASAGRGVYREAIETGALIAECRRQLCLLFRGGKAEHFIFTLNCSHGLNLAIKGLINGANPGHAICSDIDHNSVLRPFNKLAENGWLTQTRLPIDPVSGLLDPDDVRQAIRSETRLIVATQASNVSGTVQPIREIGAIAREHGIPFLVDAAQAVGHIPIDLEADNIDLLAAPGHKGLLGPLGTGFLYIRPGLEKLLSTLEEGGTGSVSEQDRQPEFLPDRYEAGSHNAIGIAGLLEGVKWIAGQTVEKLAEHDRTLSKVFLDKISQVEGLTYYGPRGLEHRTSVFSIRLKGFEPYELSRLLEKEGGVLTRPGLHCAPMAHRSFGTLEVGGTTRFSFGPFLTASDVEFAGDLVAALSRSHGAVRA